MRPGRAGWRVDAWITVLLCAGILVFGNRIAREHLRLELDLSEDRLFAPSEVGLRMLGGLEDVLQVRAFFTGDVKSGAAQIAKRRLIDQLEELVEASQGGMELDYADPNESSEARAEATALGIAPSPLRSARGTSIVTQDVWLGLVLRYRGREVVRPWILPQTFEYLFLTALRKLTREREVTIGFLVGDGRGGEDVFRELRGLLSGQYALRELLDLESGEAIPEEVSVVVVARPTELHQRVAFALDQFVQRGGRALFLVDRVQVDLASGTAAPIRTGLESLFAAWGVTVSDELCWDQERCATIRLAGTGERMLQLPFPFFPTFASDQFEREMPATATAPGDVSFFWAHPVEDAEVAGLAHTRLVWSSALSWRVPGVEGSRFDPSWLSARATELVGGGGGDSLPLAVAISGRFPSPFLGGAPAPFDEIEAALREDRARRGVEQRDAPTTTQEPVSSAATESQVLIVGDADWSSGNYFKEENKLLFLNLVDWLALEDDLLALRSRLPTERRIDDFLEQERAALGLVGPRADLAGEEAQAIAALESEADGKAARRRRLAMLGATGASLLGTLLLGVLWRLLLARVTVVPRPGEGAA